MTHGVGVLSTEGRSEGVHIRQSTAVGFNVKLTAHSHLGVLSEEILGVVNLTLLRNRQILHILSQHGGHGEHLTSSLTISGGDNRGVNVLETTLLEEEMGGEGTGVTHTGNSSNLQVK